MDERIEKAFAIANRMATLANQRRIVLEEFNQKLVYYENGGTFKIGPELINFTKTILDLGHTEGVAFIDSSNFPVVINDVQEFFDTIVEAYFQAINDYSVKFAHLASQRKISDIVEL